MLHRTCLLACNAATAAPPHAMHASINSSTVLEPISRASTSGQRGSWESYTGTISPHAPAVPAPGRIELIVGPMFAGKSSELLKRARAAETAGHSVLLIKSAKDTRYKLSSVTTHDGDHMPCITAEHLLPLLEEHLADIKSAQVVAIDEGQFFSDLLDFVTQSAEQHGKRVIVAGLDGDFLRRRFGQLLDLVPLADQVDKLASRCFAVGCQHPAIFSRRITADQQQEVVGGVDVYRAVCRHHYHHAMAAGTINI